MLKNLKTALFQTFSTWHRILSAFTALYWPSTAFYWPSTTKYQPVPPYTDPVPSWINHYRLILIQCHQIPTSTASYWPSTTKYQPVPPPTDPVPPSTNQYHLLLTQCHHISTSTASYWPSTTKYQPVPTYTVFAWGLQTPAQFTTGLVFILFSALNVVVSAWAPPQERFRLIWPLFHCSYTLKMRRFNLYSQEPFSLSTSQ